MKYQIIAFLIAINYISCTVTLTKVNKGSCANSKYTFTLTGTTDAAITGSTSTVAVTLSSPASTTATCTIADATAPGSTPSQEEQQTPSQEEQQTPQDPQTPQQGDNEDEDQDGNIRRLAAGDVTITCSISTALDGATLTVGGVKVNNVDAVITNIVQITDKVTCKASEGGNDGNEDDSGKFIQLSGLLLLFILFAF